MSAKRAGAAGRRRRSLELDDFRRDPLVRLGLACNAECPFCNVPPGCRGHAKKVTTAEAKREIEKVALAGEPRLALSGGEPTLRKDLPELVRYARGLGIPSVELQTNAIALRSKGKVRKLQSAGLTHAFVGLHSHIPAVHDFLTRFKGSFAACGAGILNLCAAGVEVTLNPVVTVANFRYMSGYMEFVRERFPAVRSVSLSVVQPHGRAWRHRILLPRYGLISEPIEKAVEAGEKAGLIVVNPFCGLPLCVAGWHKRLESCVEYREARLGRRPGDGEKIHVEICRGCAARRYCGGVWKEYPLLHPLTDLTPLKRKDIKT